MTPDETGSPQYDWASLPSVLNEAETAAKLAEARRRGRVREAVERGHTLRLAAAVPIMVWTLVCATVLLLYVILPLLRLLTGAVGDLEVDGWVAGVGATVALGEVAGVWAALILIRDVLRPRSWLVISVLAGGAVALVIVMMTLGGDAEGVDWVVLAVSLYLLGVALAQLRRARRLRRLIDEELGRECRHEAAGVAPDRPGNEVGVTTGSGQERRDLSRKGGPSADADEAAVEPPAAESAPRPALRVRVVSAGPAHPGLRLLAAFALVPWLLGYGITGSWAVARGARALAQGLPHIDAGYSRPVTPGGLVLVGSLILAAFAVLLATALLLLAASPRRRTWTAVLVMSGLLTAGAVWAGVVGRLNPGLWLLLFLGLLLAVVFSAAARLRMPRRPRRATMVGP